MDEDFGIEFGGDYSDDDFEFVPLEEVAVREKVEEVRPRKKPRKTTRKKATTPEREVIKNAARKSLPLRTVHLLDDSEDDVPTRRIPYQTIALFRDDMPPSVEEQMKVAKKVKPKAPKKKEIVQTVGIIAFTKPSHFTIVNEEGTMSIEYDTVIDIDLITSSFIEGRKVTIGGKEYTLGTMDMSVVDDEDDRFEHLIIGNKIRVKWTTEKEELPEKEETAEDVMTKVVTDDFRKVVLDYLFVNFKEVLERKVVTLAEEKDSDEDIVAAQLRPWDIADIQYRKKGSGGEYVVSWTFEDKSMEETFPVFSKDQEESVERSAIRFAENSYYIENLKEWLFSIRYNDLVSSLNQKDIYDRSLEIYREQTDPNYLLHTLHFRYGKSRDMDGADLKRIMSEYRGKINALDVKVKQALSRMQPDELSALSGASLDNFLLTIIRRHIESSPPDFVKIQTQIANATLWRLFQDVIPTQQEIREFESQYLEVLSGNYRELVELSERAKEKKVVTTPSTKKDVGVYDQVELFERDCLLTSRRDGGDALVFDYLVETAKPILFLTGSMGQYAKFFRAKVSSGMYSISGLQQLNLAYYLPEFAMKLDVVSDREWELGLNDIGSRLVEEIRHIIGLYLRSKNPSTRTAMKATGIRSFNWSMYTTDVREMCREDTGTGYVDGEPVDLQDLTICYDGVTFTCHTIREILLILTGPGPYINKHTGKEYPREFIDKMMMRYSEEIESMRNRRILEEAEGMVSSEIEIEPREGEELIESVERYLDEESE